MNWLRHLESWLDYVVELGGANGIALGPVFRSSTHGYDTIDHFEVDPRLGTAADLEHLIEAAHSRGIRAMLTHCVMRSSNGRPCSSAASA